MEGRRLLLLTNHLGGYHVLCPGAVRFAFSLLLVATLTDRVYGWTSIANFGRLSTCIAGSPINGNGRQRTTRIAATLMVEPGSSSSPFSNDEDIASDGSTRNKNNRSKNKAKRPGNPAMEDMGFLRKRTADVLAHAASDSADPSAASLSSRGMKVERKTFHFLIDAWAFSGEVDSADMALQLLECMEDLGTLAPANKPDVRSYTKVINAISRSPSLTAGDDAERILNKMENLFKNGYFAVKPNTHTYTAVMEAHGNSCLPGSAARAEELCYIMVEKFKAGDYEVRPTARAFNAVIHAYGKTGNAQKAQEVFDRMENLYDSGVAEAKPKTFNYNALISAWANCGEEGSAQRAEEVLDRMEYLRQAGDADIKPTTVSFNAVIDAYAKSGEEGAAQKAEEILTHMGDLYEWGENVDAKPNTRSFNSVINAWAKSRNEDAVLKAEALLDLMRRMYDEGNKAVRPDVHSFCSVINGKSVFFSPKAYRFLCSDISFLSSAWARCSKPGKAERAYNLFREMRNLYEAGNPHVRPNVVAVNAVINACAYTNGDVPEQSRAMEIAHKSLKDLENSPYGMPDQVTYGTFLKVCASQLPASSTQQQIVAVLFKKCCKDGQVGNFVLQQLKAMLSADMYEELVGKSIHEHVQMEDLPKSWWCNVVEGKWRRKRSSN
jgi:pentatricopeptide repeat protein